MKSRKIRRGPYRPACDICTRRKVKCDGEGPGTVCPPCANSGRPALCSWDRYNMLHPVQSTSSGNGGKSSDSDKSSPQHPDGYNKARRQLRPVQPTTGDDRGEPNKSSPQHPESPTVQAAHNRLCYTMLTGSRIVINDGRFVQTNSAFAETHRGFNLLADATSPSAFHNSGYHLPACISDSQIEVVDAIKGWISDNKAVPIMWLYGSEGTGKTSLAKSIAAWGEQEGLLLASFLFSHSDPSRNGIHRFIPTLTYSVVQSIPETRRMIAQAIDSDPHIFSRSLEAQISNLIIRPLSTLAPSARHTFPHVLVVDGLDECQDETAPKTIVKLFSSVLSTSNLGWKVLITSRPTQAIRALFDDGSMQMSLHALDVLHIDHDQISNQLNQFDPANQQQSSMPVATPSSMLGPGGLGVGSAGWLRPATLFDDESMQMSLHTLDVLQNETQLGQFDPANQQQSGMPIATPSSMLDLGWLDIGSAGRMSLLQ